MIWYIPATVVYIIALGTIYGSVRSRVRRCNENVSGEVLATMAERVVRGLCYAAATIGYLAFWVVYLLARA